MYIVVTGAAGFIGSNLVRALNARGMNNIIAVDNLTRAEKFTNLVNCDIADYVDKHDFIARIQAGHYDGEIDAILHQGACADTMVSDGHDIMENNYRYSMILLDWCQDQDVRFIYASSAAVYGTSDTFREARVFENPLSIYAYSKFLFDQAVRQRVAREPSSQIVGLRYFSAYGPGEQHKGTTASLAFHLFRQLRSDGKVRLFAGSHGYPDGGQQRDFVAVEDIVRVNLFFLDHPEKIGIFNVGPGLARSVNDLAAAVLNGCRRAKNEAPLSLAELHSQGLLEYIAFPAALEGKYQAFTQADLTHLRAAGYGAPMVALEEGVASYMEWLDKNV